MSKSTSWLSQFADWVRETGAVAVDVVAATAAQLPANPAANTNVAANNSTAAAAPPSGKSAPVDPRAATVPATPVNSAPADPWAGTEPGERSAAGAGAVAKSAPPPKQDDIKGRHTADSLPAPPPKPRGNPRKNQPVNDIPAQELTDEEIAEQKQRVANYKTPYHPSPGDGEKVSLNDAFAELAKPNGSEVTLASTHAQQDLWEHMGKSGPPPEGFRYGGKIWLEEKRLSPEQLKTYAALDRKRNPGRYPPPKEGKGGGGGGGGKDATSQPPQSEGSDAAVKEWTNNVDEAFANLNKLQGDADALAKTQPSPETAEKIALQKTVLQEQLQTRVQEVTALQQDYERFPELSRKLGPVMGALAKLTTAATLAVTVANILSANNLKDAAMRTAQAGAGIAEAALIKAISNSSVVTAVVTQVLQMSSDQGTGTQQRIQEKLAQAAEDDLVVKTSAEFLQQEHPGAVEMKGNTPVIHDQKLWDATVAHVRQLVKDAEEKAWAATLQTMKNQAHALGLQDGMAGDHAQLTDDVKYNYDGVLYDAYKSGYKEGDAKIQPALQKARDLGASDRMAGNRQANRDAPATWNVYAAERLSEAYDEGYNGVDAGVGSETG